LPEDAVGEKPPFIVKAAHNCQWATPTLLEPAPGWVEAEAKPWTCHRDAEPRALETTERCEDCPRWEDRPAPNL
jgi:hypothetical protein